uniref:SH3 domain-containing protein n=1 Tax=Glossina brevipalpis TaxID=37001 RepID=A0A1A9WE04_9MUSC
MGKKNHLVDESSRLDLIGLFIEILHRSVALQTKHFLYPSVSDHIDGGHWDQRPVVKALYAYMPSGENQLLLDEGDRIALVGGKAKGWQFGENLRTQMFGWFPVSYTNTELINDNKSMKSERHHERYDNVHYERNGSSIRSSYQEHQYRDSEHHHDNGIDSDATYRRDRADETSPTRMFGDTYRQQKKYRPPTNGNNPRPGPPPTLPAPVPSAQNATRMLNSSQSFCASNGANSAIERRKQKIQNGQQQGPSHNRLFLTRQQTNMNQMKPSAAATAAKTSLHSSNDSGFANEPPPQPEIDYSDDEQPSSRVPIRRRADTNTSHAINREIASWTLSRNFRSSVDSQIDDNKSFKTLNRGSNGKMMKYDLIASDDELLQASSSGGIKRTKSFWKFGGGRSDDILAGMSLWQHRDLVTARNVEELRDEGYRTTSSKMESEREMDKTDTLTKSNSILSSPSQENQPPRKESITSLEMYDDDENIYGMTSVSREPVIVQNSRNSTGFTPKSRMKIMKTIEIDIENPAENERLNTLKRGQKAEYRENNMIHDQQQQQLQYKQQHLNNRNSIMENKTKQNSRLNHGNHKKSYDMKTNQHHTSGNNQGRQGLVSSQNRHKSEEAFPSTESEAGESELDNGTLKMSDVNNFFDNNGTGEGIIMKTVKRKDILKQYYTSEEESDEPDIKSTSSDPYDCIVINDHLVRKDEKHRRALQMQEHQMEFQTFRATTSTTTSTTAAPINSSNTKQKQKLHHGDVERNRSTNKQMYDQQDQERYNNTLTRQGSNIITTPTATILPRTRLMKSSASMTLERSSNNVGQSQSKTNNMNGNNKRDEHYGKTYGPWYDFWDQQDNIPQNQKANKMK